MKMIFVFRLIACYMYSSLFALFVCVLNTNGMHALVSPTFLAIFPAMAMGTLLYSLMDSKTYLIKKVGLTYRILAIYVIGLCFLLFGINPNIFNYNSIPLVITCAIFGLSMGYLLADMHVYLYRSLYSKKLVGLAAGVFMLGYYLVYNIFFPATSHILTFIERSDYVFIFCVISIIILLAVVFIDQIFIRNKEVEADDIILIKEFDEIKRRLIFITLLTIEISFLLITTWGWYLSHAFFEQWLYISKGDFFQSTFLPLEFVAILIVMATLSFLPGYITLYGTQAVVIVTSIVAIVTFLLGYKDSVLLDIAFLGLAMCGGGLIVLLNYYILIFFRGGLIAIFVPIGFCIYIFFISIVQIVIHVFSLIPFVMLNNLILIGVLLGLITMFITMSFFRLRLKIKTI